MNHLKATLCAVVLLVLCACSHTSPQYGVSAANVELLKSTGTASSQKISIDPFTSFKPGARSRVCRAEGNVATPNGKPYEKYIEEALISEVKLAGLFDGASKIVLTGHLDGIDFNSNIGAGKWLIDMTFSAPNIEPFKINTVHRFSTNFVAGVACQQVAQEFPIAVQKLINDLVSHPSFKEVLKNPR